MFKPNIFRMRGQHFKKEMRAVSKWTVSKNTSSLTVEKGITEKEEISALE